MFDNVLEDLRAKCRAYDLKPTLRSMLRMLLTDGTTATLLYRLMRFFQKAGLAPLAFLVYRWNSILGHAIIGRNADVAPGFVMLHSLCIVINTNVRAGRNFTIQHGVTIGTAGSGNPVIGDNVFIGAGAKVIGGVKIGNDVRIGANAVVVNDLPDGATAVGVPARVVRIYGKKLDDAADPGAQTRDAEP
jgi:serine O-acetyltransferase